MGRILGIDVGQKRIGLAVSDPLGIFATGLDTVPAGEIFKFILEYSAKESIDVFVIGLPVQMNNAPSESVRFIDPFIKKLEKMFPAVPIKRIDERFTSKMAKQAMIDSGSTKQTRRNKALVDKISAAIMLQSFLDQSKIFRQ
jgi:putative holliday junction resolvase